MEHGSESFHVVEQLLPIALILISAKIAGVLSLRIGIPAVFGELLVGLLLGPSVLVLSFITFFLFRRSYALFITLLSSLVTTT